MLQNLGDFTPDPIAREHPKPQANAGKPVGEQQLHNPKGIAKAGPLLKLPAGFEHLEQVRTSALQRKLHLLWVPLAKIQSERLAKVQTDYQYQELVQLRHERTALLREKAQSLRELSKQDVEVVREKLKDENPAVRLEGILVVAARRPHLESDLIDLLSDAQPVVREAAHQALVRLGRGTDFGPSVTASAAQREQAVTRWRSWLVLQGGSGSELRPTAEIRADGKQIVAETTLDPEAARLSKQLVQAPAGRQEELIGKLEEGKGGVYTQALAAAIPQLAGRIRDQAREALAGRLARMSADTLRDKLTDGDLEVRRAAALACAMKEEKAHIPELIGLLEDPEPPVARAARAALKSLTGQDFGPESSASRAERADAVKAWKDWWAKQQKSR